MKNKLLGTMPLVILLSACELKQNGGSEAGSSGSSFSAARMTGETFCVDRARYDLVCTRIAFDEELGFPTQFCGPASGTDDSAWMEATREAVQAEATASLGVDRDGRARIFLAGKSAAFTDADLVGFARYGIVGGAPIGFGVYAQDGVALSDSCAVSE